MDYLNQFVIPFSGLKTGMHHFEYTIDAAFFEAIEYAEIDNGNFKVHLELEKQERMMILFFDFTGSVNVMCDRCLERFDCMLSFSRRFIIKYGSEHQEISDEIIMIPETDHQVNIGHLIYEYIILGLPVKRIHPENADGTTQCNPNMIDKLKNRSVSDTNDPRWDALKNIKLDN